MPWSNGQKISLEKLKLDIQNNPKGRKAFKDFKRKPYGLPETRPFKDVLDEQLQSKEDNK